MATRRRKVLLITAFLLLGASIYYTCIKDDDTITRPDVQHWPQGIRSDIGPVEPVRLVRNDIRPVQPVKADVKRDQNRADVLQDMDAKKEKEDEADRESVESWKQLVFTDDKHRLNEYCNSPEQPITGEEGSAPGSYELQSVYVMIRHGDRSPIYQMEGLNTVRLSCLLDPAKAPYHPRLQDYALKMLRESRKLREGTMMHRFGIYPRDKRCQPGMLTAIGAVQHLQIGSYLRDIYHMHHKLFQKQGFWDSTYVLSTKYQRTFQSALAFMFGFSDDFNLNLLHFNFTDMVNFCDEAFSGSQCFCNAFTKYRMKAETAYSKYVKPYRRFMNNIKSELSTILDMDPFELPGGNALLDSLMPLVCHKKPLPCEKGCVSAKYLNKLWHYGDSVGSHDIKSFPMIQMQTIRSYPLLREITKRMVTMATKGSGPKFIVYSGHDTTLAPMLMTLGIHEGKWPPYASRIIFELYKKVTSADTAKYFFKILFNGKDKTMNLNFCRPASGTDGLCQLEDLVKFVEHDLLNLLFKSSSYDQACENS